MNEEYIKQALLWYITDEEKELASRVSYGDLGKILAENHGKHCGGKGCDDFTVFGNRKGVRVVRGKDVAELTWNKAAKIIHGECMQGRKEQN